MNEAKEGIYKQYALDNKITEEQSREHFEKAKETRIQNYKDNQDYRAADKIKHESYENYRNYVNTFNRVASGPKVEVFVKESKRVRPEHFTNANKRKQLINELTEECKKNNEIDEKFYNDENFAKIRMIVILKDVDSKN